MNSDILDAGRWREVCGTGVHVFGLRVPHPHFAFLVVQHTALSHLASKRTTSEQSLFLQLQIPPTRSTAAVHCISGV